MTGLGVTEQSEAWTTGEILARRHLVSAGSSDRSGDSAGALLAGLLIGRPMAYRLQPDELPPPCRRRAEDGLAQYVGLVCSVELDPQARGQSYPEVTLTVRLTDPGARAVSLRSDGAGLLFDDGVGSWPAELAELQRVRPRRLGGLGRPAPVDGQRPGELTVNGLLSPAFSWTFTAPQGSALAARAFATHAVVELPVTASELSGEVSCTAVVQRHISTVFKRVPGSLVGDPSRFTERLNGTAPPPLDTGRACRLIVSVDLERYRRHFVDSGLSTQERLSALLTAALAATGSAVQDWQPGGDSVMLVFPPGIDEMAVLHTFYRQLHDGLKTTNLDLNEHARLRLRIGVDRGLTCRGATGWPGHAPIYASRLRDCKPAIATLGATPSADLALTVTDAIYRDVFAEPGRHPAPASFQRCEVTDPDKDFAATAWVHVPSGDRGGPPR